MIKDVKIKTKLIVLFVLIKIIPLLIITFIAYEGVLQLERYLQKSTKFMFDENKQIVLNTANASIKDSIKYLDKKSQLAFERLSYEIASNVAQFLYERDKDTLFLSNIPINKKTLQEFYNTKRRDIITHEEFHYDESTNKWIRIHKENRIKREKTTANLIDNEKEFNFTDPIQLNKKSIPIYKEITLFDLNGKEKIKVSQINKKLLDISKKTNTYINSETYFNEIQNLKKGELYVSEVIGEYVPSKVIGTFTKEKAKKMGIKFEPEKYAYAGRENPVGKRFEAIIRFITPVFKNGKKTGYISLALDHEHIMQFTDTSNPTSITPIQDIADASDGNYAFMWDFKGRNISHPRDFFIAGFNKETGKREIPWLSADIAKKFQSSNKEINEFLRDYPTFEDQSLKKKPNIAQLKNDGNIGLDCRYLNFAPQCEGWMQVTQNGGYGSFIIYWSKVWKLTTAASIPYYTSRYGNSKRGFGFVTIGANVDEFHSAANETKKSIDNILTKQTEKMKEAVDNNKFEIEEFINALINELSIVTFIMIVLIIAIAIWVSNYITLKIENLLIGTKKFAKNDFDYKIKVTSNDEIGKLEHSFNNMTEKIKESIVEQNEALSKAKKADEAKSIFLANISHEIRTPLNAIIGFSEVLSNNSSLDKNSKKFADIITTSAHSLLTIINDILDISKIQSGNFEISKESMNLKLISEEIIELFSHKAKEKSLQINFNYQDSIPEYIISDPVRIKQVISNILGNAIKFTPEFGTIQYNISLLEKKANKVKVRMEFIDSGIGIAEEKIDTIFKPFMQIDNNANREFEGTGLGLSICSYIIKALGSKIEIESKEAQGTRFHFDLEFETARTIEEEKKDRNNQIKESKTLQGKILIAEDNKTNQELISYLMQDFELDYKITNDGKEVLDAYKDDTSYDLILMDINMPVMDGQTAFKMIREFENENKLENKPIIAITANAIKGDKERFLDLGMNGYISKPINSITLYKTLNKFLKNLTNDSKENESFDNNKEQTNSKLTVETVTKKIAVSDNVAKLIIEKFKKDIIRDLKELEKYIAENDIEKIQDKAHYIKNSTLNVGLDDISGLLQELEHLNDKSKVQIDELYEKIYSSIKSLL